MAKDFRLPVPRGLYLVIFGLSGLTGLIYESIWSHYLKLFLGHAAYAQSLVLMIFMGGMAVGAWYASRVSEQSRSPLLIYAGIEIVVGFAALIFHQVFVGTMDFYFGSVLPNVDNSLLASLLKWSAAGFLILPQSILLGMTFPLMSAGIIRRYKSGMGGNIALLYFMNSIGAAIGALVSGFWLVSKFGLPGTILTAGIVNVMLGVVVYMMTRLDPVQKPAAIKKTEPDPQATSQTGVFIVAAFLTGAASFIYEIGWIRMLSHVLGATTHSFEIMLSAFITGLALGGLWIHRKIDRIDSPVRFSGTVQLFMGLLALMTIPIFTASFGWMEWLLKALDTTPSGYTVYSAASHTIALAVMLPTTIAAGMTLPLFTFVLLRAGDGERSIGRIYAANTVGAIVGVLVAINIGLPYLGMKNLIILGALLDVGLGIYLLTRGRATFMYRGVAAAVSIGVIGFLIAYSLDMRVIASGVFRHGNAAIFESSEVLYARDGQTASITVVEMEDGLTSLATNGKPDASIQTNPAKSIAADEVTTALLGSLALAYNPDATQIANIGLGSGITTHTLLAGAKIETVDTIEIERTVTEAARFFGDRVARIYEDERSRIHIEDAKTYFSMRNTKYDLIIAEPSNPWVSGVASLFSLEFYAAIRSNLKDDGLFAQWIQLYEFNDALTASILKAYAQSFDDYVVYTMDSGNILLVGKNKGALGEPDWSALLDGGYADELNAIGIFSAQDLQIRLAAKKPIIDGMLSLTPVPANSDYFPFVDQNAGRARFMAQRAGQITSLHGVPYPLLEMMNGAMLDYSAVAPTQWLLHTERIRTAQGIAEYLETGTVSDEDLAETIQDQLVKTEWLVAANERCSVDVNANVSRDVMLAIAENVLPYLNKTDGETVLAALDRTHCDEADSSDANWFALYAAVARRDAGLMAKMADSLLSDDDSGYSHRHSVYAIRVGLLGAIAQQDMNKADSLLERFLPVVFDGRGMPDDVRLLAAMVATAK